ncbi:KilA, N-terminal/APSES-type HTH, DNA-binding family [Trichomonas vaginalis G3]|uniref:KilA, N-terminal/APSES-type HTH, DNA-binding family n=1 Tax=Trichomonas vaginalis (strain ATCC PRA-98 / G3) TaxID=412133 RepID=UPI0021E5BDF3|nr:KilA, N-terminal/APSES-type HTH, DNA-binding family [Trichomonas vaginalis G3]KAI5501108.1 KilA, N-terminal/APSES-type HTH, DNA-binding family [Trichomonas vaginalis G3]
MSVEAKTFTNKSNGETFTKGTYNGIEVLRRDKDGYINATKMAREAERLNHLNRFLNSTKMQEILEFWLKEYGGAKSGSTSKQAFYELTRGVINEFKGIYIHPDLVHFVAEWCSVKYAFYVKDIMDSIDKKVHEKLDEEELEDTVENAKPCSNKKLEKCAKNKMNMNVRYIIVIEILHTN